MRGACFLSPAAMLNGCCGVEMFYSTCAGATGEQTALMTILIYSLVIIWPSVPMIGETPALSLLQ